MLRTTMTRISIPSDQQEIWLEPMRESTAPFTFVSLDVGPLPEPTTALTARVQVREFFITVSEEAGQGGYERHFEEQIARMLARPGMETLCPEGTQIILTRRGVRPFAEYEPQAGPGWTDRVSLTLSSIPLQLGS